MTRPTTPLAQAYGFYLALWRWNAGLSLRAAGHRLDCSHVMVLKLEQGVTLPTAARKHQVERLFKQPPGAWEHAAVTHVKEPPCA